MTRKQLPFFIGFFVLMFGAMACACLGSGVGIGGFTATANAALTQAASSASTAESQGNSLSGTAAAVGSSAEATANAEATQAIATANAAGGGTTAQATDTPASGSQPTAAATTGSTGAATEAGSASGGPSDIPLVDAQNTIQVATANLISYSTSADAPTVIKFYKDAMPKNGWTFNSSLSVETATASTLAYTKAGRTANIVIGTAGGQTIVAITVQ